MKGTDLEMSITDET